MNRNLSKIAVPVGVVGIVLLLVVPVPSWLLDILIILNVLLALTIPIRVSPGQRRSRLSGSAATARSG